MGVNGRVNKKKLELETDHDAGADAICVNRLRREHQKSTVLEMCIYVAWRKSAHNTVTFIIFETYSLLRFPGMIPVMTLCNRPAICQAADPPFECPRRLF